MPATLKTRLTLDALDTRDLPSTVPLGWNAVGPQPEPPTHPSPAARSNPQPTPPLTGILLPALREKSDWAGAVPSDPVLGGKVNTLPVKIDPQPAPPRALPAVQTPAGKTAILIGLLRPPLDRLPAVQNVAQPPLGKLSAAPTVAPAFEAVNLSRVSGVPVGGGPRVDYSGGHHRSDAPSFFSTAAQVDREAPIVLSGIAVG